MTRRHLTSFDAPPSGATPLTPIAVGDVVQLDPQHHLGERPGFFAGCFMLVTEVTTWGAQGFVSMPGERGTPPGRADYRAKWDEMVLVGRAEWIPADDIEETR